MKLYCWQPGDFTIMRSTLSLVVLLLITGQTFFISLKIMFSSHYFTLTAATLYYLLCAVTCQSMCQMGTEGAFSYSAFSRQYEDLVFDCRQLCSDLCYSWRLQTRKLKMHAHGKWQIYGYRVIILTSHV